MQKDDLKAVAVIALGILGLAAVAAALGKKKCNYCGHENDSSAKTCSKCGRNL